MRQRVRWLDGIPGTQSCPTLCDPTDGSPPGSSVRGILQARTLGWAACPPPGDLPDSGSNPPPQGCHSSLWPWDAKDGVPVYGLFPACYIFPVFISAKAKPSASVPGVTLRTLEGLHFIHLIVNPSGISFSNNRNAISNLKKKTKINYSPLKNVADTESNLV